MADPYKVALAAFDVAQPELGFRVAAPAIRAMVKAILAGLDADGCLSPHGQRVLAPLLSKPTAGLVKRTGAEALFRARKQES